MSAKAVRVFTCELYPLAEKSEHKVIRARWMDLARQSQEALNFLWQRWEHWHLSNGSVPALKAWLAAAKAWHERRECREKEDVKPRCPVVGMPPDLSKLVYRGLADEFPDLHSRVRVLLQNKWQTGLVSRKAANGSLGGWQAILLCREGRPSTTHPAPIEFDKANAKLLAPLETGGAYRMRLRFDRVVANGKAGGHVDECGLNFKGAKANSVVAKVFDGRYKFCGSSLVWNDSRRKWLLALAYQRGSECRADLDHEQVAVLRPGHYRPWQLRIGGRTLRLGGEGRDVVAVRRKLLTARWSRQEHYRRAGSSQKGHGRRRAMLPIENYSRVWKHFVRARNHNLTKDVLRILCERGIGRLIYVQPTGERRDSRFLSTAGKIRGRRDSSTWDWFQVGTQLRYKANDVGVECDVQKRSEKVTV